MSGIITFPKLGKMGRLGNCLFQIAATIGCAKDHGFSFLFPDWEFASRFPNLAGHYGGVDGLPVYREPKFSYTKISVTGSTSLEGYFQRYREKF